MLHRKWLRFAVLSAAGVFAAALNFTECRGDDIAENTKKDPVDTAAMKGLDWLKSVQKENGAWSDENYPAITALGLWAFAGSAHPAKDDICKRAATFIAGFVQPDGGIYKPATGGRGSGGLSTYNTAICMTALHAYDPVKYAQIVLKAREYVAGSQLQGDSPGAGGFGYERGSGPRNRADLSNTAWMLMAMRATQGIEDLRPAGGKRVDIDWNASLKFIEKLQITDKGNAEDYGGFVYEAGGERGKSAVDKKGAVKLAGYGSMTYAGLESMIYAQVGRDDPRVRSAIDWALRHWTVEENPGMGAKGLFYFYTIMAKALSLYGGDKLQAAGGKAIDWRGDLAAKLIKIQRQDGSWVNVDNTFWEGDPVLVTAYALLTMQRLGKVE